ncbi:hypothetical protein [Microbacterium sp. Root180]|uniref:hypothetical protein n=1 Tax=Microbacterium sp. Root180 TaxID=1736483 RepID=UPI0006F9B635|nr:hypothetical protein [Microbacterium sp. Root180]KRB38798.1 hypothetical protein ASD93_02325 [Microbacterium sp. Root180]
MDGIAQWTDFNVAMVGATAALAGLVIVAASVNIAEIITSRTLTSRLAAAIAALVLAIVVSAVGLVPDVSPLWYGVAVLLATATAAIFQVHATSVISRDPTPEDRARFLKALLGFAPIVCYAVAGTMLLVGHSAGLAVAAGGAIIAIISAIVVSWIALVEVLR